MIQYGVEMVLHTLMPLMAWENCMAVDAVRIGTGKVVFIALSLEEMTIAAVLSHGNLKLHF
jgi:hypothetical protein